MRKEAADNPHDEAAGLTDSQQTSRKPGVGSERFYRQESPLETIRDHRYAGGPVLLLLSPVLLLLSPYS